MAGGGLNSARVKFSGPPAALAAETVASRLFGGTLGRATKTNGASDRMSTGNGLASD